MISLVGCWQLLAASEILWWTNRQKVARVATSPSRPSPLFTGMPSQHRLLGCTRFLLGIAKLQTSSHVCIDYIDHIYSIYISTLEGFGCYATNNALRGYTICSTWFRAYFKHLGAGKTLTPQMFRQKSWPIEGQGPLYPLGSNITCPNYSGSTQTFKVIHARYQHIALLLRCITHFDITQNHLH